MTQLKNKGYIYKVTNIITGQFYIGQRSSYTGEPEDDLGVHYFTSSKYVKPLFRNNTSEWKKEILYRDIQYAETLDDVEGYAIHKEIKDPLCENKYDPTICPGFSNTGKKLSAETRAKMSEAKLGKCHSEETRAKIGAAHRGQHFSEEHRAKLRGHQCSAETHAKMKEAAKHRPPISEETRAKMSVANSGKHRSAEAIAKTSAANRGKHRSAETKAKMQEAWKHRPPMSAETRAKMSLAAKRRHIHHLEDE